MCLAQAETFTGRVRNTRDNVNDLFGWGPGDESKGSNITIVNRLPGGDIEAPGMPNRSTLKTTGKK
jgi:hypothetical protein